MNTPSKNAEKRLQAHLKYDSHGVAVLKDSRIYVVGGDEAKVQDTEWMARNKSAVVGDLTVEMLMSPAGVERNGKYWNTPMRPCMSGNVQQAVRNNSAITVPMQPVMAVRSCADPDSVVPTEIKAVPDMRNQAVGFQRAASRTVRSVGDSAANIANQGGPEELVRHFVDIKGLLVKLLGAITSVTHGFELIALGPRAKITVQTTSTTFNDRSAATSFSGVGIPDDILGLLATAMLRNGDLHVRHPDDYGSMDPFYRYDIDGISAQTWFTDSRVPIGRAAWNSSAAQRLYNFLCKKVPPKKIQKALNTVSMLRTTYTPIRAPADVAARGPVDGFEISKPSMVRHDAVQHGQDVDNPFLPGFVNALRDTDIPPNLVAPIPGAVAPPLPMAFAADEARQALPPNDNDLDALAVGILRMGGFNAFSVSGVEIVRGAAQQLGGNPAPEIAGELRIYWRGPAQGVPANQPLAFPIETQGPGGQLTASDFSTWRHLTSYAVGAPETRCVRVEDMPDYIPGGQTRDTSVRNCFGLLDAQSLIIVPSFSGKGVGAWLVGLLDLAPQADDGHSRDHMDYAELANYDNRAGRVAHLRFNATRYIYSCDPATCNSKKMEGAMFQVLDTAPVGSWATVECIDDQCEPWPTIECQEMPTVDGTPGGRAPGRGLDGGYYITQVESEEVKFQVADNNLRALDSFCRYALTIGRRGELTFRDQPVAQARVADLSDADLERPLLPCYFLPTMLRWRRAARKTEMYMTGLVSALASGNTNTLTEMFI